MNNNKCFHSESNNFGCINCTPVNGEYKPDLRYHEVIDDLRRLTGQILTTLEATIDNENKLKATKDIVKGYMSQTMQVLWTRTLQGQDKYQEPKLAISPEL